MNCKKCGAMISDHYSFCPYCGSVNHPVSLNSTNDGNLDIGESKSEEIADNHIEDVPLENSPILGITLIIALISALCIWGSIQYEKAHFIKIQEMSTDHEEDETEGKNRSSSNITVTKKSKNTTVDDERDMDKEGATDNKLNNAEAKDKSTNTLDSPDTVQELFELLLGGQEERIYNDETSSDGSIIIGTETPSEDNNFAHYYIAGRGFSYIYDSDIISHDEEIDSWFFESYGYYYMIISEEQGSYSVYYSNNLDILTNGKGDICGRFSLVM